MTDKLQGNRVLVTGAGGFIGSYLVEALVQRGANVRAFIRYTSRADVGLLRFASHRVRQSIELIAGDIRDQDAIERAADDCQFIFHLGALISIPYSYHHPVEVVESNIMGTLNVLQACRRLGCRMIHTSTSEVYGTALRVPIDEDHPLQGQSPYSASKIGADKLVESYVRSFGVHALTIRPFNTYGPRQSARAVIPTIITQALTQDVIHLGNLDSLRDFTYISDTVNAFILAAESQGLDGEVFNLGTNQEISIRDLAEAICALSGSKVSIEIDQERLRPEKSEVMRLISDNRKALEHLGWSPEVDIQNGLQQTITWIRDHLDFYRPGKYER